MTPDERHHNSAIVTGTRVWRRTRCLLGWQEVPRVCTRATSARSPCLANDFSRPMIRTSGRELSIQLCLQSSSLCFPLNPIQWATTSIPFVCQSREQLQCCSRASLAYPLDSQQQRAMRKMSFSSTKSERREETCAKATGCWSEMRKSYSPFGRQNLCACENFFSLVSSALLLPLS